MPFINICPQIFGFAHCGCPMAVWIREVNKMEVGLVRTMQGEPGKIGGAGFFFILLYGTEDSEESGPDVEISRRDLYPGRAVDGKGIQI